MTGVLMLVAGLLVAIQGQAPDSLPGAIPPSGPATYVALTLLGIGSSLVTKGVAGAAAGLDRAVGSVDQKIRNGIGPMLPVVTLGLATLLPKLTDAIGIASVDPAVVANAPLAALIGITTREVVRKWLIPALGLKKH